VPPLPPTKAYEPDKGTHTDFSPTPPTSQHLPRQERGQRPARALAYALEVTGKIDQVQGRYVLDFANTGSLGACFSVSSSLRSDGPWTYTVEAGKALSDYWTSANSGDAYDLTVLGPNGFLRQFSGKQPAQGDDRRRLALPEVTMSEGRHTGELRLMLTNAGGRPCAITVEATAYLHQPPQRFWLQPGERAEAHFDIGSCDHWYDLTATSDADPLFLRRFAGHRDTGKASFSDPAFGS
jgi:phospholipase C